MLRLAVMFGPLHRWMEFVLGRWLPVFAVATLVVALAFLTFVLGSVHIVHGQQARSWPLGVAVCPKLRWTFRDTILDLNDYVHRPDRVDELDPNAISALCRCGVLDCYKP